MPGFAADHYGPLADLLAGNQRMPLARGTPNHSARSKLDQLSVAFDQLAVKDRDMARCCQAGLWLYHGFLDESHEISQAVHTPAGSYWHALMHRREPDYSNSKYWFHRVGRQPIFEPLQEHAAKLARRAGLTPAAFLTVQQEWDPFAFVDLCEKAREDASLTDLCRDIQQREWELLFEFCYRQALD